MSEGEERKPVPRWLKEALEEAAGPNYRPAHTEDMARVEYQGGFMDFLDQAYNREVPLVQMHMLEGGNPEAGITSIEEYLANVRVAIEDFGENAFALLMNPIDYAKLEMLDRELNGSYIWDGGPDQRLYFGGLLVQQALFIEENRYAIMDQWAFDELEKQNPERL